MYNNRKYLSICERCLMGVEFVITIVAIIKFHIQEKHKREIRTI